MDAYLPEPDPLNEVDVACAGVASQIVTMVALGVLPANIWAFVRVADVWGHPDQVTIWSVLVSPN